MTPEEIRELMHLRGWNMMKLATELDLTENAIAKWLMKNGKPPKGPTAILLRQWLAEAKSKPKPRAASKAEPVPA